MRLDRRLTRNLGWSRAEVAAALRRGRIVGAGGVALDPRDPAVREVEVDGVPRTLLDHVVVMQHKPRGAVTALSDPALPTAYALLADAPLVRDLRPIGRLDRDTSGLLLWTDDGDLVHRLTHPKTGVERTYHAAVARPWREPGPDLRLADGTAPGLVSIRPIDDVHPALDRAGATLFAEIRLTSGSYHEVRRVLAALGSHVLGLCRTAHGDYTLPRELEPGRWRVVHAC